MMNVVSQTFGWSMEHAMLTPLGLKQLFNKDCKTNAYKNGMMI
jgi:hypothetical protein